MRINLDSELMYLGIRKFKNAITRQNIGKFSFLPNSLIYDNTKYIGASLTALPDGTKYVTIPEGITMRRTIKALNAVTLKGTLAEGAKIIAPKYDSTATAVLKGEIRASHSAYLRGKYKGAVIRSIAVSSASDAEIIKCEIFAPMARRNNGDETVLGGGTVGLGGKIIDTNIKAMGNVHFMPDTHMKRGSICTRDELFLWGRLDEVYLGADNGITVYNIAKVNNYTFEPGTKVTSGVVVKPLSRKEKAKQGYRENKSEEKGDGGKKTHKQQTPRKHKPKDILEPILARYVAQIKKMRKQTEGYFKMANKVTQPGRKEKVVDTVS